MNKEGLKGKGSGNSGLSKVSWRVRDFLESLASSIVYTYTSKRYMLVPNSTLYPVFGFRKGATTLDICETKRFRGEAMVKMKGFV